MSVLERDKILNIISGRIRLIFFLPKFCNVTMIEKSKLTKISQLKNKPNSFRLPGNEFTFQLSLQNIHIAHEFSNNFFANHPYHHYKCENVFFCYVSFKLCNTFFGCMATVLH